MKLGAVDSRSSIDELLLDNSIKIRGRAGSGNDLDNIRGDDDGMTYPTLQVRRSNDDFWAFDTALRNKFKLVKFPDFPRVGYSAALRGAKISE